MMDPNFDLPGWSTAIDPRTGRQYFINLQEKTTTWEDPRAKLRNVYGSAIPMQTLHGSPKKSQVQVYPTQSYPAQAFQSYPGQSVNASPIASTKTSQHSHTVEMSSLSRSSPHTPRIGNLIKNHQLQQQQMETSFSTQSATPSHAETEATVAKINTMFPTASEHHIRLLLKKYHHREAVVISALQVEKHPLTTPGPYTPPVQRSFHTTAMALSAFQTPPSSSILSRKGVQLLHGGDHLTIASSSNGSPIPMRPQSSSSFYTVATTATTGMYGSPRYGDHYRSSPKPHSSPKMKLRYLKSQFTKCEETIILDVLAMVDNNVQKASEQLARMGYEKKEMTPAPRLSHRKLQENQPKKEVLQPTPPPKPKTADEKKKMRARLQSQYKDSIPEKIVLMALESVDYSEEKALKILDIVIQEDKDTKKKNEKKRSDVEKNVSFKDTSLRGSKCIDLDSAAAIENDETMIINSDHSIITTPVSDEASTSGVQKAPLETRPESDETPTSDSSVSEAVAVEKNKRHRPKARSESNRSEKNVPIVKKDKNEGKQAKKVMFEDADDTFLSLLARSSTVGPNPCLAKGPQDDILLTDYVIWNGANPEIMKGHRACANGPNASLRIDRSYTARGRSSELCKGPNIGLAKGSMYSHVACN